MAKPKWERKDVFDETVDDPDPLPQRNVPPGKVPHIPVSALNPVYETGAKGFPDIDFVSPEEKRIEELERQLAEVAQHLENGALALQDGNLVVEGFQFSPIGLVAPEQFSEETWQQIGILLFRLEGSIQWLIGDWIVYGGQVGWGDLPYLAEKLGRSLQTLYNYSSVARAVEYYRRREELSFGHHDAVTKLEPDAQDAALAFAAENKLSVAAFRKWIKEQQGEAELPALPVDEPTTFKQLSGNLDKLYEVDPERAKPQQRIQASVAYQLAAERLENFRRKWGL